MKKFVAAFLLTLSIGAMYGCSSEPEQAVNDRAPLQTEGATKPPRGCVELRERGGAC